MTSNSKPKKITQSEKNQIYSNLCMKLGDVKYNISILKAQAEDIETQIHELAKVEVVDGEVQNDSRD